MADGCPLAPTTQFLLCVFSVATSSSLKTIKSQVTQATELSRQQSLSMYDGSVGSQEAIVERAKQVPPFGDTVIYSFILYVKFYFTYLIWFGVLVL